MDNRATQRGRRRLSRRAQPSWAQWLGTCLPYKGRLHPEAQVDLTGARRDDECVTDERTDPWSGENRETILREFALDASTDRRTPAPLPVRIAKRPCQRMGLTSLTQKRS